MSFIFRRLFSTTTPATMDAAKTKAQQMIDENAVSKYLHKLKPDHFVLG
jgi:hypothetical protein